MDDIEEYVCECGSLRYRGGGLPEVACLACAAYDRIDSGGRLDAAAFERILIEAGRAHGPVLLSNAWSYSVIDDETLIRHVGPVWCGAEFPDRALSWGSWIDLFDAAGYTVDGKSSARPDVPIVLYRAAPRTHRLGHSWTEDLSVAQHFLTLRGREQHAPRLWTATVEPDRLLARIVEDRHGEPQYVIETEGLEVVEHTMHTHEAGK